AGHRGTGRPGRAWGPAHPAGHPRRARPVHEAGLQGGAARPVPGVRPAGRRDGSRTGAAGGGPVTGTRTSDEVRRGYAYGLAAYLWWGFMPIYIRLLEPSG